MGNINESEEYEYKLVAPDIDRLLSIFGHDYLNPSVPSAALVTAMEPLFTILRDLAPIENNDEVKAIWLMVPRGEIADYDSYEDLLRWQEVSSRKEYEKIWLRDYPEPVKWYKLSISESFDKAGNVNHRSVMVGSTLIINAMLEDGLPEEERCGGSWKEEAAILLCKLLPAAAEHSMQMLQEDTYNQYVSDNLPYWFRTGVIKRNVLWTVEPEARESIFDGLSDEVYDRFQTLMESGENDEKKLKVMPSMTGADFLHACAIGYKVCGYKGTELPEVDQYILHADRRDEGLTGKGDISHRGNGGIDLHSPAAWDAWYHHREIHGGHPWEVCRGGNSTHVDLFVIDSRQEADWEYARGKITQEEAERIQKEGGYYFAVGGAAWNRSVEAVNFYVAIHDAGLPVVLRKAEAILARFRGKDIVGVVPRNITPRYCEGMFPEKYGTILDFIHVYDEDPWRDQIEWLPEEEAKLIGKG